MAAPTPVSAYLHSATMVKLGVYLLARVDPLFGDRDDWMALLVGAGTATMLVAAVLALRERDLKRILAYSTVVALGTLAVTLAACGMSYGTLGLGRLWPFAIVVVIGQQFAGPIERRVRGERGKAACRVAGMAIVAIVLVGLAIARTEASSAEDGGDGDLLDAYGMHAL